MDTLIYGQIQPGAIAARICDHHRVSAGRCSTVWFTSGLQPSARVLPEAGRSNVVGAIDRLYPICLPPLGQVAACDLGRSSTYQADDRAEAVVAGQETLPRRMAMGGSRRVTAAADKPL